MPMDTENVKNEALNTVAGALFDERELRLILNCVNYANGDPAGLPGHNLMVIVAKLCALYGFDARTYLEGRHG